MSAAVATVEIDGHQHETGHVAINFTPEGGLEGSFDSWQVHGTIPDRFSLTFTTKTGWAVAVVCETTRYTFGGLTFVCHPLVARQGSMTAGEDVHNYNFVSKLEFKPRWGTHAPGHGYSTFSPADLQGMELHQYPGFFHKGLTAYFSWDAPYDSSNELPGGRLDNLFNLLCLAEGAILDFPAVLIEGRRGKVLHLRPFDEETVGGDGPARGDPCRFIDKTYDKYCEWSPKLNLWVPIHHLALMNNTRYADHKYLMGSVVMESMKTGYATYKGYQYIKGAWWDGKTKKNFETIVTELYDEFKVDGADLDFITYRNEVVHRGYIGIPAAEMFARLTYLKVSIHQLFFNILGYDLLGYDLPTYRVV